VQRCVKIKRDSFDTFIADIYLNDLCVFIYSNSIIENYTLLSPNYLLTRHHSAVLHAQLINCNRMNSVIVNV